MKNIEAAAMMVALLAPVFGCRVRSPVEPDVAHAAPPMVHTDLATSADLRQEPAAVKTPTQAPPRCATAADVARFDGQEVELVGMYRKKLSAHKMGQPATTFMGRIVIELPGRPSEYDPTSSPDATAEIALGTKPRPADEVASMTGRKISVFGTLAIDPSKGQPPPRGASEYPEPTLLMPRDLRLVE